jgi:hypothetical protein
VVPAQNARPPFLIVLGKKKESKENPLDSSFQKPSEGEVQLYATNVVRPGVPRCREPLFSFQCIIIIRLSKAFTISCPIHGSNVKRFLIYMIQNTPQLSDKNFNTLILFRFSISYSARRRFPSCDKLFLTNIHLISTGPKVSALYLVTGWRSAYQVLIRY